MRHQHAQKKHRRQNAFPNHVLSIDKLLVVTKWQQIFIIQIVAMPQHYYKLVEKSARQIDAKLCVKRRWQQNKLTPNAYLVRK